MQTAMIRKNISLNVPDDLPEVEYPEEVIERWNREVAIAEMQIAAGELKPESVEDFAARYGIRINGR